MSVGNQREKKQRELMGLNSKGTKTRLLHCHGGLTLIELIVVLIIIGMIAAMVVPRLIGSITRLDLTTTAKNISSALRNARSQAVSEQIIYYAVFDFEKNGCFIHAEKPIEDEKGYPTHESVTGGTADSPISGASLVKSYFLPESIKIEKALRSDKQTDSGLFIIEFYPAGNSSGGSVILISEKEHRLKLNVDSITGVVNIEEPDRSP